MAQAPVGAVLLVKPNAGVRETYELPSERQLFDTRLVGAIGTVAFGAVTMHLLIEPALLLFGRLISPFLWPPVAACLGRPFERTWKALGRCS